jgi:hypothetical protein
MDHHLPPEDQPEHVQDGREREDDNRDGGERFHVACQRYTDMEGKVQGKPMSPCTLLTPRTCEIFRVVAFNPEHWLLVFGIGILPLVAMEFWKAAWARS